MGYDVAVPPPKWSTESDAGVKSTNADAQYSKLYVNTLYSECIDLMCDTTFINGTNCIQVLCEEGIFC